MAFSDKIVQVWDEWEIRALLLLSLSLQVILTTLGSVRKRSTSTWIRLFVWSAYMSAGMVTSVALGILAMDNKGENSNQLFWTPFLVLHLGGPDTITAYSLEDNELWPRQFLDILFQIGVAAYVVLKSWGEIELLWIALPVFIAGSIKYSERTWVLKLSSTQNLRDFLFSDPDPGPDYPDFMEKKSRDIDSESSLPPSATPPQRYSGSPDDHLSQAYYLFNRFTYLFADLILGYDERQDCHSMICDKSSEEAFELVEGELGLLYDALYTKLTALHFRYRGYRRRCFTLFVTVFALTSYKIFGDDDSSADTLITYLLLIGAVGLEVYGFFVLILSDWTKLCVLRYVKVNRVRIGKRWSRKISKFSMIKFCLRKQDQDTMWIRFLNKLSIEEKVAKILNVEYEQVESELKSLIFQELKDRSENINSSFDVNSCKKLLSYRGDSVLDKMECLELLKWSTTDVEFDHSLLLWHIATQLCYFDDATRAVQGSNSLQNLKKHSKISKGLSEYMMYILVMHPNMLPKGIGEIRFKDTCAEAIRFFQRKKKEIGTKVDEACHNLYEIDTNFLEQAKGDATKSVLFYGSRLAKQLQSLGFERKWVLMNKVWVESLSFAAVHCGWKEHGQQLRRGGELLTHVCLLMAHLGLSEQYQIQKQYFRIHQEKRRDKLPLCYPFLKIFARFVYRWKV
ncbi:hypothetical protein F3Y22_tig00112231pilonHSYRG00054 [Hibiscus syriacus]|uniref:DUF4220 domain-containing protein n=1 Tax=Hibiscus syriacus TaxID=106335 RepID=A0A6A2X423_HIBSY|nr:uncharacterized protein LOC120176206 [Hibiscus syriacus]KAE8669498.1 hypothetical protein F3Y22_tig00112231pilonHSYRG00054 [Hibiscus syriacus]